MEGNQSTLESGLCVVRVQVSSISGDSGKSAKKKVRRERERERGKMNVSEIYEATNEEIKLAWYFDIVHRRNSQRQDWRPP